MSDTAARVEQALASPQAHAVEASALAAAPAVEAEAEHAIAAVVSGRPGLSLGLKLAGVAAIGCAILTLELTGHAPVGTFLNQFATPMMTFLGVYGAAKNLN